MTVTEAPRDVVEATETTRTAQPSGLAALVGSGDPRTVGKLFVGTSLLFSLVAGVTGSLVGVERVDAASATDVLSADTAGQVFSLHSVAAVFLFLLPLLVGLATAVVPLQVGASTVAFPRASAAAYWTYLVSGGLVLTGFGINGGPFGGDADGVSLFMLGFIAVLVAVCAATISVVATVITLRAPGMTLRRMPLFSWSMLVAGTVWLLTLPVLAAVMLLVYLDHRYGQQFLGGPTGIYDRIVWTFWLPTLYAFAVPALGIVSDIVPVFAQRRFFRHRGAMVLIGLFGALAAGAWVQLGFSIDGEPVEPPWLFDGPWIAVAIVAAIAVVGLFGLWLGTLAKGRPRLGSPLILAISGALLVLAGVLSGLVTVSKRADAFDTTWMTAQSHAILIGTALVGFAGLVYWAPKLYGRRFPERVTGLGGMLLLLGTLALAGSDAISGLEDQLRFIGGGAEAASDTDLIETLNLVAIVGGAVVALGILLLLGALASTALGRRGPAPGDDPWRGHTLEWATSSPPPVGNFAGLPEISSEAPLYDARHATETPTEESA